jgi:uncharacterized coiled-coil protein SlyX
MRSLIKPFYQKALSGEVLMHKQPPITVRSLVPQGLEGTVNEAFFIRIGDPGSIETCFIAGNSGVPVAGGDPVTVDGNGQLGIAPAGRPLSANELLKEHKKVEEQQASIAELKATVAQQQKGMDVLTAQLEEQAAQIQKVSAQLEMSKPAPRVVVNKP